jgi:hypothetical protein
LFSRGFTDDFNSFLGFLRLRLRFSFLRFLGLGLGLRLNKMDLAYVCMYVLSIIQNSILYIGLMYMYVSCIILYGIKYMITYQTFV